MIGRDGVHDRGLIGISRAELENQTRQTGASDILRGDHELRPLRDYALVLKIPCQLLLINDVFKIRMIYSDGIRETTQGISLSG